MTDLVNRLRAAALEATKWDPGLNPPLSVWSDQRHRPSHHDPETPMTDRVHAAAQALVARWNSVHPRFRYTVDAALPGLRTLLDALAVALSADADSLCWGPDHDWEEIVPPFEPHPDDIMRVTHRCRTCGLHGAPPHEHDWTTLVQASEAPVDVCTTCGIRRPDEGRWLATGDPSPALHGFPYPTKSGHDPAWEPLYIAPGTQVAEICRLCGGTRFWTRTLLLNPAWVTDIYLEPDGSIRMIEDPTSPPDTRPEVNPQ